MPAPEELPLNEKDFTFELTVEVDGRRSDPFNLNDVKEKYISRT